MPVERFLRSGNSLEINVGSVKTPQELHRLLSDAFQFPENYGKNWDDFEEYLQEIDVPGVIQINNFKILDSCLPQEAEFLSRCLEDFKEYHEPGIVIRIR